MSFPFFAFVLLVGDADFEFAMVLECLKKFVGKTVFCE